MMIYVIEDDHGVRKALELLLRSNNYNFRSYTKGEEFLKDVAENSINDILILDMNMAGTYSRDFLKQLIFTRSPVSIIGITAHDETDIRAYCREYGVKALLTKPVDSHALIDLIKYHSEVNSA